MYLATNSEFHPMRHQMICF